MSLDVTAVILAAGRSQRMGEVNKLLADWRGKKMVHHLVETALGSKAKDVVVVAGYQASELKQALKGYQVHIVENRDFAQGLSTSLKAGLAALDPGVSGAAILLADMPDLQTETLDKLIVAFQDKRGEAIVVPVCEGRRGNPVIWPRSLFPDIFNISGDKGARDVLKKYPERMERVSCDDSGVLRDIDTPGDF